MKAMGNETAGVQALLVGLFVLCPILLGISSRMRAGSLPKTTNIGIRTPHTRASDQAWRRGHRAAAGLTEFAGWWALIWALTGAVMFSAATEPYFAVGVGYVGLAVVCVDIWVTADHAASGDPRRSHAPGSSHRRPE